MQSYCDHRANLHVAIIMDGNGRWATRRHLARTAGHRAGVESVRSISAAAPGLGISRLTLFAFSSDNWRRPPEEVHSIMALLQRYIRRELRRLVDNGIRLTVIGRRDRLPRRLADEIDQAERITAAGCRLHLCIAVDYSSREAIVRAASLLGADHQPSQESFSKLIARLSDGGDNSPAVDLLIRSGGEKRLSDFLLWESAYAELWFSEKMWPDFGPEDLQAAVAEFHHRDRRFGGLSNVA